MSQSWHIEKHFSNRNNWLRAGVLGANDGLISTASLLMGMSCSRSESPNFAFNRNCSHDFGSSLNGSW